jgi:hypothetical protein
MKGETKEIMDVLSELKEDMKRHQSTEEERIRHIEKRQWMIMGAAAVAGFIIGNTSLMNLLG